MKRRVFILFLLRGCFLPRVIEEKESSTRSVVDIHSHTCSAALLYHTNVDVGVWHLRTASVHVYVYDLKPSVLCLRLVSCIVVVWW